MLQSATNPTKSNKLDLSLGFQYKEFRELYIDLVRQAIPEKQNWQHYHTPYSIVDEMISKTSVKNKSILVLFNLEFIERLSCIKDVDWNKIRFVADTDTEKFVAENLYGVKSILMTESQWKQNQQQCVQQIKGLIDMEKFDLCFSNPPYNKNIDINILKNIYGICNELIVVHPSTWLIDRKGIYKPFINFKNDIKDSLKSARLFNGNPIFKDDNGKSIGLFVPCIITHIDKTKQSGSPIYGKFFDREFDANSIYDITIFGPEWKAIVEPFKNEMEKTISTTGSVWNHNVTKIDKNKFYAQFSPIRGNSQRDDENRIVKDDFYTLFSKESSKEKGIWQPNLQRPGNLTPTFPFNTQTKVDNFIEYMKTYLARFCLSILKVSQNTSLGEMSLIPWLDFAQSWDDQKLMNKFRIGPETQKYIYDFLPDYYGIGRPAIVHPANPVTI